MDVQAVFTWDSDGRHHALVERVEPPGFFSYRLSAMADPSRRRLLDELATRGQATATSLTGVLTITRQAVVKHLAVLSRSGLVNGLRQGREVRYAVHTGSLAATAQWMAGLASEWDSRLAEVKRNPESPAGS